MEFDDNMLGMSESVSLAKHVDQVEANHFPQSRGHSGLEEEEEEGEELPTC